MENILLPILIALLSPIFTTWLALRKFRHEQKWQKKVGVIEELCETIDKIILQGEIWEKDINRQNQLLGKDSKVFNIFTEELAKLKTCATKVDILFDWEFSKEIDELISELEKAYSESVRENNPGDFSYVWLKKMKEFRIEFVKKVKNAVNWKKGFRRIAIIWAIMVAIVGGVFGFKIADEEAANELEHAQSMLQTFEKGNGVSQSYLLDEWKRCKSFEDQEQKWKFWTGEDLEESFKKSAVAEKNFRNLESFVKGSNEEKYFREASEETYTSTMSQESRERLKEQGWQTVAGEVQLPYTPDMVSGIIKNRDIKENQNNLRKALLLYRFHRLLGTAVGGAVAFGVFCLGYLILERLVSGTACLVLWVASGFHDTIPSKKVEIRK